MGDKQKHSWKRYEFLGQFVDLANFLKPGVEWPAPGEVEQLAAKMKIASLDAKRLDAAWTSEERLNAAVYPVWKAACKRFAPRKTDAISMIPEPGTIAVVRRPDGIPAVFNSPLILYKAAYLTRAALRLVATAGESEPKLPLSLELPASDARIQVLPGGAIVTGSDFYRDFLLRALDAVNIHDVRVCRACGNLFIAKRKDQGGCTRVCASALRQKRFRDEHPGYHKRFERESRWRSALCRTLSAAA